MAYKTKKMYDLASIKKLVKKGQTSFQGKTKKYPLVNKAGDILVTKIEVKADNPNGLYAVLHTAKGNQQKDYNPSAYAKRQVKKYEKLAKLRSPKIKNEQVRLAVDIAIATGIRAGSSDDTEAIGILKLERGHVKFDRSGKRAVLDFIGKSGVHQKIKLNGNLAPRIMKLVKSKKMSERLFDVTYPHVNVALKKVNLKDFRTKLACDIARKYVDSLNGSAPTTKREYKFHVEAMTSLVATELGHKKGNGELNLGTSKKSYIDPKIFQKLSDKVDDKGKLLTKRERDIAKKGSMWEKKLLPIVI